MSSSYATSCSKRNKKLILQYNPINKLNISAYFSELRRSNLTQNGFAFKTEPKKLYTSYSAGRPCSLSIHLPPEWDLPPEWTQAYYFITVRLTRIVKLVHSAMIYTWGGGIWTRHIFFKHYSQIRKWLTSTRNENVHSLVLNWEGQCFHLQSIKKK